MVFEISKAKVDSVTGEQRWFALGSVDPKEPVVLLVVHVYRGQNEEQTIRIISARKASQKERRPYLAQPGL